MNAHARIVPDMAALLRRDSLAEAALIAARAGASIACCAVTMNISPQPNVNF